MVRSGASTVRVAEAVFPVPPLVEVTGSLVLFLTPAVVAVTLTASVQEAPAATVAPVRLRVVLPAAGAKAPPQVLLAPGTAATCRPDGSVSLKPTPVSATVVFGFVMVNVRVAEPPSRMVEGANALLILGGATTVMLAEAVLPVPPFAEVTFPLVLTFTPPLVPVMLTPTVQELLV